MDSDFVFFKIYDTIWTLQAYCPVSRRPGSGALRRIGPVGEQYLKDFIATTPKTTCEKLAALLEQKGLTDKDVSRRSLNCYHKERYDYDYVGSSLKDHCADR